MFKNNTLIILGAGASRELGFPLGYELRQEIADKLKWNGAPVGHFVSDSCPADDAFYKLVYGHSHPQVNRELRPIPDLREQRRWDVWNQIRRGMPFASSIDEFLQMRRDETELIKVAKLAIKAVIAKQERSLGLPLASSSSSSFDRWLVKADGIESKKQPAWTAFFSEVCFSGAARDEIGKALDRVTIISFNYDRLIEQFTEIAICNLYNLPADVARHEANNLAVFHPYGSLGELFGSRPVSWGEVSSEAAFGDILTFAEGSHTLSDEMAARLSRAERVMFLGFGYHAQNIELLSRLTHFKCKSIVGTCLGLSEESKKSASMRLKNAFGMNSRDVELGKINLQPVGCAELLSARKVELSE